MKPGVCDVGETLDPSFLEAIGGAMAAPFDSLVPQGRKGALGGACSCTMVTSNRLCEAREMSKQLLVPSSPWVP